MELIKRTFKTKDIARRQAEIFRVRYGGNLLLPWTQFCAELMSGAIKTDLSGWSQLYGMLVATFLCDRNLLDTEKGEDNYKVSQPAYWVMASIRLMGKDLPAIETTIAETKAVADLMLDGEKVYEIAPALAQRLAHTDVRGVDCANVKLPFRTIALKVPPESGFDIHEVIIHEAPPRDWVPNSARQALSAEDSTMRGLYEVFPDTLPRCFGFYGSRSNSVDDVVWSTFWLPDGMHIDVANAKQMGAVGQDIDVARFTTFCMNAILYLTWPDANEEFEERYGSEYRLARSRLSHLSGYKKERLKAQMRGMYPDRRIYVGAKVPFMEAQSVSGGAGNPLIVRTLVAGHWKQQPCGPKQSERKLIRVEPYWRGPLDAPIENNVRKVS